MNDIHNGGGSPHYRGNNRGGYNNNNNNSGGGGDENVEDYMLDYKEKRKLLVRWSCYFPNEVVKEFDVIYTTPIDNNYSPMTSSTCASMFSTKLSVMKNIKLF